MSGGDFTGIMRRLLYPPVLVLTGLLAISGCSGKKPAAPKTASAAHSGSPAAAHQPKLIVTPDDALVGKVSLVNTDGRFVVLTFPIGRMPTADQRLNVYRQGLKTGELKVSSDRLDVNVLADIVTGDAKMGDEVRDK